MLRKVTISGSYSKFRKELEDTIKEFQRLGVEVLSPKSARIVGVCKQAYSLDGDVVPRLDCINNEYFSRAVKAVEDSHLDAIRRSDALWVIANDGYFGVSACLEIGYAAGKKIPIFYDSRYKDMITDPRIKKQMTPIESIEELVRKFENKSWLYVVEGGAIRVSL